MSARMLTVEAVAKRTGYTKGSLKNIMCDAGEHFPPPRMYGEHGRKFFAAEDITVWLKGRSIKRRKRR